jgi:membrane fusion protein, multidrug efflux system
MKNAMIIPQKATFEILEKKYVFVIDQENLVHQREITISASLPHLYIVKEGIQPSERILLEGIRKVRDGDKIEYDFQDMKEVLPHLDVYTE